VAQQNVNSSKPVLQEPQIPDPLAASVSSVAAARKMGKAIIPSDRRSKGSQRLDCNEAIAGSSKHEPWGEERTFRRGHDGPRDGRKVAKTISGAPAQQRGRSNRLSHPPSRSHARFLCVLSRLLGDLETTFWPARVKGTRYTNSGYRDIVVIEFCYPALVVAVSALSNGSKNAERLYVLDLIEQNDSLLWHE